MLRKPTEIGRATLQEVPLSIVLPEADGVGTRRVTLLLQSEPQIEIAIFTLESGMTVEQALKSIDARDSYWAQPPLDVVLPIEILPNQFLVGRAVLGIHELGVIVEYLP